MAERKVTCSVRCLSAEDVARAREELGDGPAVLLPYTCKVTGETEEILLLSEKTAEDLAETMGYFDLPETVAIFAAVSTTELCECDIATLIGGDEGDVLAEIERMAAGGFLVSREIGGMAYFSAGNPPLKRFFLNRYAPERKKRF